MATAALTITTLAFALVPTVVMSVAGDEGQAEWRSIELHGRCDYAASANQFVGSNTGFALCDSVVIVRDRTRSTFDFRRHRQGSQVRYDGELSGDTMTITHVQARNRAAQAATGECTIYYRQDRISTVTCIATVQHVTLAANFVR